MHFAHVFHLHTDTSQQQCTLTVNVTQDLVCIHNDRPKHGSFSFLVHWEVVVVVYSSFQGKQTMVRPFQLPLDKSAEPTTNCFS